MIPFPLVLRLFFRVGTLSTLLAANAHAASITVVISQIYGGGGNKGATLTNDFIELFNRGTTPVNLNGWTVQHAAAAGSVWDQTILSGVIQPGQYYLVQEQHGQGGVVSLPVPDAVGNIGISETADKIALVSNSIDLTGHNPSGSVIADFVGYGDADASEGHPANELNNTIALFRKSGGCTDTDDNSDDFVTGAPNPRNTKSGANPCPPAEALPGAPQISQNGVVNSATLAGGPIAPGEIVTIYGSNLGPPQLVTLQLTPDGIHVANSLAGTRVLFDGVPAPIVYTSTSQVSAVVPFSQAQPASTLQVEYDAQVSNLVSLQVAPAALGVFTENSSGCGQAAVLNQDYSINSAAKPAAKGSVIIAYATGAGQTTPTSEDGRVVGGATLPTPIQAVSASIGGLNADVVYAGAAPGFLSGVLQVNLKIPEDSATVGRVPLVINIGAISSQAGVDVWITSSN